VLLDVDEIDWAGLNHAYGPAEDVPDLLRTLASAEPDQADEALADVIGSLFHQGTVYEATVSAVPFLVELGRTAPHQRAAIVGTIGMLADPRHAYGTAADAVRAAVVAEADRLLPLLSDPDAKVRAAAAYAVAQCGDAIPAEVLRDRRAVEDSPEAHASLLLALGLRDPAGSADLLRAAVLHAPHPVRVAAALAILRLGGGWPGGAAAAIAEAFASGADVEYVWQHRGSALDEFVSRVDDGLAADLLDRLLAAPAPVARRAAIWALGERCQARRSAPGLLVPRLEGVLADPDETVRDCAIRALRRAGAAAGRFADALAGVAAGYPRVAGDTAITVEAAAVETLMLLADERWLDPVCAAWAAGHRVRLPLDGPPFDPVILDAVRQRLAAPAPVVGGDGDGGRVVAGLLRLVYRWGPAAAAAAPELLAALPVAPLAAARAFAAIRVPAPGALPHLREAAVAGDLESGVGLWRLAGDAAPLADAVQRRLARRGLGLAQELALAAEAGTALRPAVPALRGYLTETVGRTEPERAAQVAAARIAWLATGDAAEALPAVVAALAGGGAPARAAADLAGQMPEPSLAPALRALLRDRLARVAAARALWHLGGPAGPLVPVLIAAIEGGYDVEGAIGLLVEMDAAEALPELRRLAEGEERGDPAGTVDDTVWNDERLQRELRAAVEMLSGQE
jgi:hypothetical protein